MWFQIVWDEAKKKWVNQDGEEEVAAPPPPPPKSPLGGSGGPPVMKMRGLKSKLNWYLRLHYFNLSQIFFLFICRYCW